MFRQHATTTTSNNNNNNNSQSYCSYHDGKHQCTTHILASWRWSHVGAVINKFRTFFSFKITESITLPKHQGDYSPFRVDFGISHVYRQSQPKNTCPLGGWGHVVESAFLTARGILAVGPGCRVPPLPLLEFSRAAWNVSVVPPPRVTRVVDTTCVVQGHHHGRPQ